MIDEKSFALAREGAKVALLGMITYDEDAALQGLTMLQEAGSFGVFAACVGWATIIEKQTGITPGPGSFVAMRVAARDLTTGEPLRVVDNPDTLAPDVAPAIWAGRFVAARANGDMDTCESLFFAPGGRLLTDCVFALLELTAAHVRPLLAADGPD